MGSEMCIRDSSHTADSGSDSAGTDSHTADSGSDSAGMDSHTADSDFDSTDMDSCYLDTFCFTNSFLIIVAICQRT